LVVTNVVALQLTILKVPLLAAVTKPVILTGSPAGKKVGNVPVYVVLPATAFAAAVKASEVPGTKAPLVPVLMQT
jgi:hypothetical protein